MSGGRCGEFSAAPGRHCQRQRGVALAMVVWFIAAMSLLVVGIVHEARVDVRLAQTHLARAKVAAAGDGAINLLLSRQGELRAERQSPADGEEPVLDGEFALGQLRVRVQMVPVSRLIKVYSEKPGPLAALFAERGGISRGEAQRLADNVVQLRNPRGRRGSGPALETPEDLLRIEGFDRALLDAIRDDITALDRGYRLDAVMDYDGRRWLRRRWVSLQAAGPSLLPWQIKRTEAPRVIGG
ncbi:hypothetical protein [Kineobactrum salinum]|uniref:General secretion pathway protein GspK n=1 Tax=Kineobactrum salinum TaxID=2708301 RepID=A0A6C0U301_9GAMM|nr:hypothetical protein [Kineobactrum salinum]QIB66318.1 hypothetical protein G3T16_13785 [Kineobactrum salinum]